MRLVKFELKPNSKCPVMRLCILMLSLLSFIAPARTTRLARLPASPLFSTLRPTAMRAATSACKNSAHLACASPFAHHHARARLVAMSEAEDSSTAGGRKERVLILGAGWVGSRLATKLSEAGCDVAVTNRPGSSEKVKPMYFRPVTMPGKVKPRVVFEINDRETWANLPPATEYDSVVVTFPLSTKNCMAFFDEYLSTVQNVVCYSSTSVYQIDTPGQHVDENTKLKPTLRTEVEGYFLSKGATVLTISGIFGEPRGPRGVCACLTAYSSAGGSLNGGSSINMVHVDDILAATCCCLDQPHKSRGLRLNVAGTHFQLSDLVAHCKHPYVSDGGGADYNSKVVSSKRLLEEVMPEGYEFVPAL